MKKFKVKKAFIYDEDGVFKNIPLKRYDAFLSNFITRDEKISFILSGKIPIPIREVISRIEDFKIEVCESFLGIELSVFVDDGNFQILPHPVSDSNVLVICRFGGKTKSCFIVDKSVYGSFEILDLFI
jgi:hypothetical protein